MLKAETLTCFFKFMLNAETHMCLTHHPLPVFLFCLVVFITKTYSLTTYHLP